MYQIMDQFIVADVHTHPNMHTVLVRYFQHIVTSIALSMVDSADLRT